jgi:hypothetical protein
MLFRRLVCLMFCFSSFAFAAKGDAPSARQVCARKLAASARDRQQERVPGAYYDDLSNEDFVGTRGGYLDEDPDVRGVSDDLHH